MYLCCSQWSCSVSRLDDEPSYLASGLDMKLFYFECIICLLILHISESLDKLVDEYLAQTWFVEYVTKNEFYSLFTHQITISLKAIITKLNGPQ